MSPEILNENLSFAEQVQGQDVLISANANALVYVPGHLMCVSTDTPKLIKPDGLPEFPVDQEKFHHVTIAHNHKKKPKVQPFQSILLLAAVNEENPKLLTTVEGSEPKFQKITLKKKMLNFPMEKPFHFVFLS